MTQQASSGSVQQDGLSGWWRAYLRHRYAVLFYSLFLTIVGGPFLKAIGLTGILLLVFLGLNLLAAAPQVESRKGRWLPPAILLAAVLIRICHSPHRPRAFGGSRAGDHCPTQSGAAPTDPPTMLDENEFLSPYGIRSLSKFHEQHPYVLHVGDQEYRVDYLPAESNTGMFGGNSNWRGPV